MISIRTLCFAAVSLCGSLQMIGADCSEKSLMAAEESCKEWKDFNALAGKCKIAFPEAPEHVHQTLAMPEEGYNLHYDVYVSSSDRKAVYMVLVAQYPPFVDEKYAEMSLESFLNGILSQNEKNRLIFADLVEVDGHKGMDFFIQTGSMYFKGRAIMAKNNLYLLAMECDMKNYVDGHFNYFINSFKLTK